MAQEPTLAPAGDATPRPQRTFGKHRCLACGEVFTATHNRQTKYCPAHSATKHHDKLKVRGRQMVELAQCWRANRGTSDPTKKQIARYAFNELCALADLYNAEDRAAGVGHAATESVRRMWVDGYRPSTDGKRKRK